MPATTAAKGTKKEKIYPITVATLWLSFAVSSKYLPHFYKNIAILTQYILLILTQLYNSRSCSKKASNTLTKPEEYFEEIRK